MLTDRRENLKPAEYPDFLEYRDAIRHSYWVHTEYNLTDDVQDFLTRVKPHEQNAIKNTMLAIAQVEVAVKTFWGDIYKRFPKPEVGAVGYTFAESEVRHQDAYSHLLEILGLNKEFEKLTEIPALYDRVQFLNKHIKYVPDPDPAVDNRNYAITVLLFSVFVEYVSLFSQFLIMKAFNKHRGLFKGIANIVEATSKEEQIHGMFGFRIIEVLKQEFPDWFSGDFDEMVIEACLKAYEAEEKMLDWIFEQGELDFLPISHIKAFIQARFNESLGEVGIPPQWEVDPEGTEATLWFDEEILATKHYDFFHKRPTMYSRKTKAITEDDLFG